MPSILEALRLTASILMLLYASVRDIKTREVSDLLWIIGGSIGFALDLHALFLGVYRPLGLLSSIGISTLLAYVIAYLGLFGGADFKALTALSLLLPHPPGFSPLLGVVSPLYPLTIFSNSVLAGASLSILILLRNLLKALRGVSLFEGLSDPWWRKLLVLLTGFRKPLSSVRGPPFEYSLEILEDGCRRLVLLPSLESDEEAVRVLRELRDAGVGEIWVSSTLPFLLLITIGLLLSLILGDIPLWLIFKLLEAGKMG